MSLLVRPIPSLHGGVSQQSPLVRSPEQLESQINGWSSLAEGLKKRAPSVSVARLAQAAPSNALVHTINRDTTEQFVVVTSAAGIQIFDAHTGESQEFQALGNSLAYLTGVTDYAADISMFTVADYTFVTNRKMVCGMAPLGTDTNADPNYYRALNRAIGLDENGVPYSPGSAYQYEPNLTTGPLTGTVQRFDKLPATATEGQVYMVQGDDESNFTSYYVVYRGGVWNECVKPGLVNAIDAETMPHALVRGSDGVFRLAPFSWAPRRLGDTNSNPNPGFIGRTIRKVLWYQNRLAFLTGEVTVMSGAGDLGNFWRMSALDYLDSDVIEVAATSTKVATLMDATSHVDGILLTSDQQQFSLSNGEIGISAASIAIRPTTAYTVNARAGLCSVGSEIYFSTENNGWAQIYEYTRLAGADTTTAANVTAHVPTYIPAGVHQIIGANDMGSLFVLTKGAPSKVFAYQFYWTSGDEKAQSAWHEWDFGSDAEIISAEYLKGRLYLCVKRGSGLWLERVDLQSGARPNETSQEVHLDRRCVVTGTYDTDTNRTVFMLPYAPDQASFELVRSDAFASQRQTLIDPATYVWITGNQVSVPGFENAGPVLAGTRYEFSFEFSTPYVRKQGGEAITSGRLQVLSVTLSHADTGFYRTSVAPYGNDPQIEEVVPSLLAVMTGRVIGAASLKLNTPVLHTGHNRFKVLGQNTQARVRITNDTHVASTFVAAEWECLYNNRARF